MATTAGAPVRAGSGNSNPVTIGVLALQGDYEAHARAFKSAGARTVLVRKPEELVGLDGLVMPGGESTTMLKFLEKDGFFDALGRLCLAPLPVSPPAPASSCSHARFSTQRNAASACSTPPSSATPTAARSTPPSSPCPPSFPAARWRWSSSARRASPAWARRSSARSPRRLPYPGAPGPSARRHLPSRDDQRHARATVLPRYGARAQGSLRAAGSCSIRLQEAWLRRPSFNAAFPLAQALPVTALWSPRRKGSQTPHPQSRCLRR